MSLLSAIILPRLEKELIALEPVLTQFLIDQGKLVAADLVTWAEQKFKNQAANTAPVVPNS